MEPIENTPWHTVARRLVPFLLLQGLLRLCWLLVWAGYGEATAREFKRDVL
ncbi:MAG: hypothetical protein V7786_02110 [Sulfitobacter litoralis]|uniref:hypothetical protein n=1 Tax=Sulfitobacter litoralis TaxID=335975 RepID=UPI0030037D69